MLENLFHLEALLGQESFLIYSQPYAQAITKFVAYESFSCLPNLC